MAFFWFPCWPPLLTVSGPTSLSSWRETAHNTSCYVRVWYQYCYPVRRPGDRHPLSYASAELPDSQESLTLSACSSAYPLPNECPYPTDYSDDLTRLCRWHASITAYKLHTQIIHVVINTLAPPVTASKFSGSEGLARAADGLSPLAPLSKLLLIGMYLVS